MNEQWYCTSPDHYCICEFNLRRAPDANFVFHHSHSGAIILYDNMLTSALDKVVTFAGEVVFERKPPTLTKTEATLDDRLDLLKSGHSKEPYLLYERERQTSLSFPIR